MTTLLDHFPHATSFEGAEQKRLDLIKDIEKTQLQRNGLLRKIRAAYLSRKALRLAQKEQVYLPQKEDLIKRAVVLNPNLEEKAHDTLDQVYDREHPELASTSIQGLPAAKDIALLALDKTIELSLDLHSDTPTEPIPVTEILAASVGIINAEQSEKIPLSPLRQRQGLLHRKKRMEVQKTERLEKASNEDLSDDDDAVKLSDDEMKALLFDDEVNVA